MAEKILAKDAKINNIYLTKGGKQVDTKGTESLWGFYPVRVIKKVVKDNTEKIKAAAVEMIEGYGIEIPDNWLGPIDSGFKITYDGINLDVPQKEAVEKKIKEMKGHEEITRVIVFTPWQTELDLSPNYPLEAADLQILPSSDPADHFINQPKTGVTKISSDGEAPSEYIEKLQDIKEGEQAPENIKKTDSFKDSILDALEKGIPVKQIAKELSTKYLKVYCYIQQLQKKGYKIQKIGKGIFQIVK